MNEIAETIEFEIPLRVNFPPERNLERVQNKSIERDENLASLLNEANHLESLRLEEERRRKEQERTALEVQFSKD